MSRSSSSALRGLSVLDVLEVRDIPEGGLVFDEALPAPWLTERLEGSHGLHWRPREEGHAQIDVEALGPVDRSPPIRLKGHLRSAVETDCVRCLTEVEQTIEVDLDLTLFPAEAVSDGGRAPSPEEGRYEEGRVPLPELVAEALLLELDMNPTCSDEAACDERTARLIEEANRPVREMEKAETPSIDPRWAPLLGYETDPSD